MQTCVSLHRTRAILYRVSGVRPNHENVSNRHAQVKVYRLLKQGESMKRIFDAAFARWYSGFYLSGIVLLILLMIDGNHCLFRFGGHDE